MVNKYLLNTLAYGTQLYWYAETALAACKEAEEAGHKITSVQIVENDVQPLAPGVVCKCPADFCPAHGRLDKTELRKGRRTRNAE